MEKLKAHTQTFEEKAMLDKVATGDEAAFRRLSYQYEPKLSSFIYRITKSKETAAEIVHEVF